LWGESVSRVPKGFDAEHPAADLIRRKQYLLDTKVDAKLAVTPQLFGEIVARIEAMMPFVVFLNEPLVKRQAKRKREEKFLR
jgi:uncharacterized protein (DUF2461 family)